MTTEWSITVIMQSYFCNNFIQIPSLRAVDGLQFQRSATSPDDLLRVPTLGVKNCREFIYVLGLGLEIL